MNIVRRFPSFKRRTKRREDSSDLVPKPKQSQKYHPKIRVDLGEKGEGEGFISHNDNAYRMSVDSAGGEPMQSLNAIYNIPSPPYQDKLVIGIEDIPMEYKQHIGKNISVPDEEDGNNLKGLILGIKTLYLEDVGYRSFYEVLFQADEEYNKAVVKLISTQKYGITVLGLETEAEMMERIEQAKSANLANRDSVEMKILEKVAQQRNRPKSPRRRPFGKKKQPLSEAVNYLQDDLGDNFAETMLQQGRSSIPDELEIGHRRPSSSRSSSPKSRSGSPETLTRGPSFGSKTKAGKKTKKAKKTKKMQKRKKQK